MKDAYGNDISAFPGAVSGGYGGLPQDFQRTYFQSPACNSEPSYETRLRDEFAIEVSGSVWTCMDKRMSADDAAKATAEFSYMIADAMLQARKQGGDYDQR